MRSQRLQVALFIFTLLLLAGWLSDRASVFSAGGQEPYQLVLEWGSPGSGPGQFSSPTDAFVHSSGDIYVTDYANHRVQRFDPNGNFLDMWGSFGSGQGELNKPEHIAEDSSGNLFVADTDNGRIQVFTPAGAFVDVWASGLARGLALDSQDNVYVVGSGTVRKYTSAGQPITSWSISSGGEDIAIDPSDDVYVLDGNKVSKFKSDGTPSLSWGSFGSGKGAFNGPQGIAVDTWGSVYVADRNNNRIQKFDSDGTLMAVIGQVSAPHGVGVDNAGAVYVAEFGAHRIRKFDPPSLPPPNPVLMIHGWRGTCDAFDDVLGFLVANGYPENWVECFDPLESETPEGQHNGYREGCMGREGSARALAQYVAGFKIRAGVGSSDKIDIVAHSFGGLVARSYIEHNGGEDHVRKLVMLGTPNSGAGVALINGAVTLSPLSFRRCGTGWFGIPLFSNDRALRDMDYAVAPVHNILYLLDPPNTTYEVIAGNSGGNEMLDLVGDNDCVVTVKSAEGPGFPIKIYGVKHTDEISILGFGICGTPHTAVYSDPTCALPRLLNALAGDATNPCSGGAGAAGAAPEHLSPPLVLAETGEFAIAGSDPYSAALDTSVTRVVYELVWVDETSNLHLEVRRPGGALVNSGDGDVTYVAPQTGVDGVVREVYSIDAPASGKWTVDVVADSVGTEGAVYQVLGAAATPVGIELSVNAGEYQTSDPIMLAATLTDGATALTGASVSVDVTRPDASTESFTLFDDGLHGDGAADDGVYGGTYGDTGACGLYTFDVTATGTASGGAFTRYAIANIAVSAPGDVVGDLCETDDDQDGCTDAAEFGDDETLGGLRDPLNPYDFYDVLGPGAALPVDGVIDLPNDILGVILHFSPQGQAPYDVNFDRGPATAAAGGGPNPWNMTAPDGVIDLPNDILGVILQFNHRCV